MSLQEITTPLALATVVAKATLLLALGACGTLALRRAPAVARHRVWLTVIVGVLLIPALANVVPMRVPVLPPVVASPAARIGDVGTAIDGGAVIPRASRLHPAGQTSLSGDIQRLRMPSVGSIALILWAGIAVVLVSWMMAGMLSVRRIIRNGRPLSADEWRRALGDATKQLELASAPRLVMSDQVEMAFAFDAFTPTVIVPASAAEWSEDRRRAVLLHELAHIRRHDLIGHIIASIACAVYWFNPFVWAAARRLRVESELATDDIVLESGVRPSDYAQHLLDMVTGVGRRAPTVALAMARPRDFEGRLVAILDRADRRRAFGKAHARATVGLLGLLTVSIAAVVPVARRTPAAPATVSLPAISAAVSQRESLIVAATSASTPRRGPSRAATTNDLGGPLSDFAIASLLRYGTSGVINPIMMLLRDADSLGLSGTQADSLATLNRWYIVRLNRIWSPVSTYYVTHGRSPNQSSVNASFRRAPSASMELLIDIVPDVTGLLTDDQRRNLPERISIYLDPRYLAEIGSGRANAPDGVFVPKLLALPGARGGGAR